MYEEIEMHIYQLLKGHAARCIYTMLLMMMMMTMMMWY